LVYDSGVEALTRIERAIEAARAHDATPRGWTLAQAIAHCGQSIECSIASYPRLRSGLFRATIGPIVKRKFLRAGAMSHDTTAAIPGAPEIAPTIVLADACDRAATAVRAFAAHDGPLAPHLAYGRCTKDEYAQLHWLHLADHLRAFAIEPPA
jgi:hypothetical protein